MIYDITKELFSAEVYPGDTVPSKRLLMTLKGENPDVCQLTELLLGSHSGSHMDAPRHFYADGKDIAAVDIRKCFGRCKLVHGEGTITAEQMAEWLKDGTKRLLIRGDIVISLPAAQEMTKGGLLLIGVEGLTVGPFSAPKPVHLETLGAEIVILESLNLSNVPEGNYRLMALPLRMKELDGSPIRAVLMDEAEWQE